MIASTSSLHQSCVEELTHWQAPDPDQAQLRQDFLTHLASAPSGWARDCPGAHLTASSLIMNRDASSVVLTLHAKLGRWLQTGGHIEANDDHVRTAALREATEESGLTGLVLDQLVRLSRHEVPCGPVRPCFHLDLQYLVIAEDDQQVAVSDESTDVRWFGVDNLPDTDESVTELVAAARARIAHR